MAYYITNANGIPLVTIQDGNLDDTTTSLTLFGNTTPNFGKAVNQNFVNLLQHWAAPNAPAIPTIGQLWYDTINTVLKIYNDNVWNIASQNINLSAINIPFTLSNYGNNPSLVATISNNSIIAITSTVNISYSSLPSYIIFNNNSYLFASLFPIGIIPGITLANSSINIIGSVSKTNKFTNLGNIILTGAVIGNVGINGTSNVNLQVSYSNVINNSGNSTVGGFWSNVTTNDSGQIIQAGNISFNDVVNALEYVPFNSADATPDLENNLVISRDNYGNFSANIMVGIAQNTMSFALDSYIILNDQVIGLSNPISDSSNIIIQTELVNSLNVAPGLYNTVTVNDSGIIQSAQIVDNMPIGSIVLYSQTYIPKGWVACNGQNVLLPTGYTITTPNLSNAVVGFVDALSYESSIIVNNNNVYIPNSNITVEVIRTGDIGATYIMHVYENSNVSSGTPNIGVLTTHLTSGNVQQIELIGGANIVYPPLTYYSNISVNPNPQTGISELIVYNNNENFYFGNNFFYDAVALILSSGDTNSVMMCATDLYGDLSQLVVQQVIYNLQNRHRQGLPPRLGKYMLSQQDIIDYIGILELPIDTTFFTIALQDEIMLLKVSDITNRYVADNIYPDDAKLFGAIYIGYWQYIAVLQADSSSTVGAALVSAGFDPTGDSYTDNLLCYQFVEAIQILISDAINIISQNQTSISITNNLNNLISQNYPLPISLIQQPKSIIGNIYTSSNVTLITVDGLKNYYGGNITINTSPGFGGGSFPFTSVKSSTEYFTTLAQSRYLNPVLTKTFNGALKVSLSTGIGIDVGNLTDVQIGNLSTLSGAVNIVVGPVDSPQPSQETLQNSLIVNQQINQNTSIKSIINNNISINTSNTSVSNNNVITHHQTITTQKKKTITQTVKQVTATSTSSTTTTNYVDTGVFSGPPILPSGVTSNTPFLSTGGGSDSDNSFGGGDIGL